MRRRSPLAVPEVGLLAAGAPGTPPIARIPPRRSPVRRHRPEARFRRACTRG
jgi:hypothetical protein